MTKKTETIIHKANGGNHSPVNYRKHKDMLLAHPYALGLLYHIVLTGSEDRKVYRKAVELLCKQLRINGMPCRYKACYERDKFKRFHKHIFILIEAKDRHPDTIIHYRKGHWMTEMLSGLGLGFKIAQPQDPIHYVSGKQVNYAYVPKKAGPKLDDCLVWISYLTKVRSKTGVDGQIYTASTNRESKDIIPLSAGSTAAEEALTLTKEQDEADFTEKQEASTSESNTSESNTSASESREGLGNARQHTSPSEDARGQQEASFYDVRENGARASPYYEKPEVMLSATDKYLASLYEQAVDADLDTDEIRRHLLNKGVVKTPGQVAWELEYIHAFTGYAASHPPKPVQSVRAWDIAAGHRS